MSEMRSSSKLYELAFDNLLTRIDPEVAHTRAFHTWQGMYSRASKLSALRDQAAAFTRPDERLTRTLFGKPLRSPLGLAAGFDKNATGIDALALLGFGAIEIGTVTGQAQPGNPKPRLFRLPKDRAIVNRMGFNNDGSEMIAQRLRERAESGEASEVILGVNIGKTKAVAVEDAAADYVLSASRLAPFADYLVVNVSSPNTPGLRDLQAVEVLRPILAATAQAANEAAGREVPLLVKLAPDLADDDIAAAAGLVGELGLAGVVATNTTIGRTGLRSSEQEIAECGEGGLSGPMLAPRSRAVLALLRSELAAAKVVISVGGVSTPDEARARLEAGANLVQAYTSFVYEGPLWPRALNRALATRPPGGAWAAGGAQ